MADRSELGWRGRLGRAGRLGARSLEAVVATSTATLVASVSLRLVPPTQHEAMLRRYRQVWAGRMLHAGGAVVTRLGQVPPLHSGPRIVVANHRSMLDTPLLMSLFGGQFLANGALATLPVLGRAARVGGVVFVDRAAPDSRVTAMRAMRRLLETGASLIVFPEGTTFCGDEVQPFHPGAFLLPPGVELLPVGIAYDTADAEYGDEPLATHAARVAERAQTRVVVAIGAPLAPDPTRRRDARALAGRAQEAVQALVRRARAGHATP